MRELRPSAIDGASIPAATAKVKPSLAVPAHSTSVQ
jgi:hypothetical protein